MILYRRTGGRGFTLIETLIYIALFVIIVGGLMVAVYGYFETIGWNATKASMEEEKSFVLGKINEALSGAEVVTTPGAGASGPILTLTKYDNTSDTVMLSSGAVVENGATLTNTNVSVSNLTFTHAASPEGVTASFTISANTPSGSTISEQASLTRYLRK